MCQQYSYVSIEPDFTFKFHRAEIIKPLPHQVLIKILHCGICATDIAIVEGKRDKKLPYLPGHEYVGIVAAAGESALGFHSGELVVGNPNYVCGGCYFCRQGEFELCENSDAPHYSNGAFAEYLAIDYRYVYRLPEGVAPPTATLTECLACAIHAVRCLPLKKYNHVLIIGAGTIGLLVANVIKEYDLARQVLVLEKLAGRQPLIQQLGAKLVDSRLVEAGKAVSIGSPIDVVFECSGNLKAVETALKTVRKGGKIILAGRTGNDETIELYPSFIARKSIMLMGSSRYIPGEFAEAVQLLAKIREHICQYVNPSRFGLAQIEAAFQAAREKKTVKTLITPNYKDGEE
jgi:L-iditol 2-dehydrogenase